MYAVCFYSEFVSNASYNCWNEEIVKDATILKHCHLGLKSYLMYLFSGQKSSVKGSPKEVGRALILSNKLRKLKFFTGEKSERYAEKSRWTNFKIFEYNIVNCWNYQKYNKMYINNNSRWYSFKQYRGLSQETVLLPIKSILQLMC